MSASASANAAAALALRPARRVLYLQNTADLYGASRALLNLLGALDRDRFAPLVVLPSGGPLVGHLRALDIDPIIAPHLRVLWASVVRSWRVLPFGLGLLPSALALSRLARQQNVALVHSNTWTILSGALGAQLAGLPHVWHIREILRSMGGLKPALLAYTVRSARRLICISAAVAAQFAGRARPDRLRIIYDGLPLSARTDPAAAVALRQRYGLGANTHLVGLIGRLHPQKGQADLLRAYAQLAPHLRATTCLVIAGDPLPGSEVLADELAALAHELGIAEQVRFLGFLADVRPMLDALDILVLPATRPEGLGGVLLEAMAARVPIIATRAGGPVELIDDGVNGLLVPPQRPDELARALERLLDDPQQRRSMATAGRQLVERRFDAAGMAAQVMQLYEEILLKRET
jgi:glycosyltransferase involved in cell wall biosynthesis